MSDDLKATDLAPASEKTLRVIVEESDKRIAAQVQVMLATDSRSNTLLSAAAALAAAAFGVAASQYPTQGLSPLVVGSAVFALSAAIAALAAVHALWPADIDVQGWSPKLFVEDLASAKSNHDLLTEIAALNQSKSDGNARCNKMIAGRVKRSMAALALAPIFGALAAILRILLPSCGA